MGTVICFLVPSGATAWQLLRR